MLYCFNCVILNDFTLGNKYTNHLMTHVDLPLQNIFFFVLFRPIVLQLHLWGEYTYVYMPDRWSNAAASHV